MNNTKRNIEIFRIFLFMFFVCFSFSAKCQEWKQFSTNDKIKIEYRYGECHDNINDLHQQRVFLRYSNLTVNEISVNLNIIPVYVKEGKELSRKSDFSENNFKLLPGQVLEGNCDAKDNYLNFFSKMLNFKSSELKDFSIKIIEIK